MPVTRYCYFAIVSLFAVLSSLAPDALGQLSRVADIIVFDTQSLLEDQESLSLSVGGQQPSECVSSMAGLDDRPTQALSPVRFQLSIDSFWAVNSTPRMCSGSWLHRSTETQMGRVR